MRELTPEEASFVASRRVEKKTTVEKRRVSLWFPPVRFIVAAVAIAPFVFTGSFFYGLSRLENVVDRKTLDVIAGSHSANNEAQQWIDEIGMLYEYREAIIASAFSIAVLIIIIVLVIDVLASRKKTKDSENG